VVAVLTAILMVVLFGFMALAIDLGVLEYQRRQLQTIADAAAVGGALEVSYGDVYTGAQTVALQNGFISQANGVTLNGATLTVSNPPADGPHATWSGCVEVIASRSQSTYFANILGINSVTVSARAVACQGSGPACLYALSSSATNAILANGTPNVQSTCGIVDDSNASEAFLCNGSGTFNVKSIGVVGGYLSNGSCTLNPTPVTSIVPQNDPLAYLPEPTPGACVTPDPSPITGNGNFTLNQGTYCGGLRINGSPTVTLNPGTYIFTGDFIVNGTPTVTGNGVTLYFTSSGSITVNGATNFNLTAPTTGTYAGILMFQDRADTAQATINGSNTSTLQGSLYFPDAPLVFNGSSGTNAAYTIIIAQSITFNGSVTLNDNYSSLPGGSPIKTAVLVE
jgi:Flp pilus assembly protein TadG